MWVGLVVSSAAVMSSLAQPGKFQILCRQYKLATLKNEGAYFTSRDPFEQQFVEKKNQCKKPVLVLVDTFSGYIVRCIVEIPLQNLAAVKLGIDVFFPPLD